MASPKKRITIILVDTDYLEAVLHKGRSASCNMLLGQVGYALDLLQKSNSHPKPSAMCQKIGVETFYITVIGLLTVLTKSFRDCVFER